MKRTGTAVTVAATGATAAASGTVTATAFGLVTVAVSGAVTIGVATALTTSLTTSGATAVCNRCRSRVDQPWWQRLCCWYSPCFYFLSAAQPTDISSDVPQLAFLCLSCRRCFPVYFSSCVRLAPHITSDAPADASSLDLLHSEVELL